MRVQLKVGYLFRTEARYTALLEKRFVLGSLPILFIKR